MADRFRELLKNRDYIIFDGAMGTMLQAAGMKMGETPEVLNITRPELLVSIAEQYFNAGSDVVYANTFGANRYKLEECGKSVEELVTAGIVNAKKARDAVKPDGLVALDVGPIGQLLEPTGVLSFEEAYDMYAEIVKAGAAAGADLVVFETMTDLLDVKAAVLAAKENSDLPIAATMTFEQNMRTFTGCSISAMALTLTGLGVDALGVNCSLGPKELEPVIEELVKWTNLPIIVKPNAGLPDPETNLYNVTAAQFADFMKDLRKYGIKIFGGCCGTNPEFIKELSEMLKREGNPAAPHKYIPGAVCSATSTVVVDEPRIIGERINPTGKKLFKEALLRHDMDYILGQALEQISGGADILDVNVGLPGIDEREMMIDTIKSLQAVVDVPLQIDSTIPEVLEAALRVYNGKPLVNSVNGEEESLNNVLPLVKKYGAGVIGLALDKDGIPKKAEDRVAIAKKIMDRAVAMGIPKEDINIDKNSVDYIKNYGAMPNVSKIDPVKKEKKDGNYTGDDLFYAVEKGLKNEGAEITEALLKTMDSMEIVNQVLIPALDKIGAEFEKGTLFLPQLIMAASVTQAAFEVIRKHMVMSDNAPVSKGKIVIATVKGDVHDIGKNIVKVLLENYGYDVIDLGKDVEYQTVVDAIRDNDVKLCGLSALMTTTLVSMKETIALIRENNLDCKVMVGGAVLTPEYAKEIDADFYAKDAKESVDIAKRVLG